MEHIILKDDFLRNTSMSVIITKEDKTITYVNPSTVKMTGYKKEELIGKSIDILTLKNHNKKNYRIFKQTIQKKNLWEGEVWNRRKNGEPFLAKRSIIKKVDEKTNTTSFIILSIDITELKTKEEQYNNLLYKDILTGLPNKHVFREIVGSNIKKAQKERRKIAITFFDVSRFHKVIESFGYLVGDGLLKEISRRLKWILQDETHLTRFQRDLFAFCFTNIKDENDIARQLDAITQNFKRIPFIVEGQEIFISLNMGVSIFPTDGSDIKELLQKADIALSKARETNNGTYQFYTTDLNVRTFEKLVMETNLRKAIHNNEFILHYQPQVNIQTGKVVGVEALVRWNHPELGIVPPNKFISLAEETGLIHPITDWVLEEACKQNKKWQDLGYEPITMAVNISTIQFKEDNFVGKIKRILMETNLNPIYLDIEITESALIKNIEEAIFKLKKLKQLGVKISIDDFGAGYSSLNYLAKLPLDTLKIDRSFIKDMDLNKEHKTITSTIIHLAHALGMDIVAEGVDSKEQLEFLKKQNCEYYQGYFFSRPVEAENIIPFLSSK